MKPEKNKNKKPLVWDYTFCVFYCALLATLILVLMYQLSNEAHIKILKSADNPVSLQIPDHIPQPLEILKKTNISLEAYNNELLSQLFRESQYQSLYDEINKAENSILTVSEGKPKSKGKSEQQQKNKKRQKGDNKVVLSYAQQVSVAKQFLKHYAANEEYYIVERQITGHLTDQVYRTAWTIRNFINQKMGIISQSQKQKVLYVLYTHSRKDVEDTLDQLLQSDEIDKIIIVATQKIKIRKFKNLGEFPRDSILEKISSLLKITTLQVLGYMNYYGVDGFFDNVKVDEASPKKHLKEHYLKLPKDIYKQKQIHNILKSLCKQKTDPSLNNIMGKNLKVLKNRLEKIGVIFENRTLYWAHDLYRLNYMIQTGSLCKESELNAEAKYRGMELMEKIILQNEKKMKQKTEKQQKKRLEFIIEQRAKQLAEQQQHQCPKCSCSIDIEKECKKIFEEMNSAQSEPQINILTNKKKVNDKIRIGLKGFEELLNKERQAVDGEINLEEIQAAIKNPSGKLQSTLEETFNNKQQGNGQIRDHDQVTNAEQNSGQSPEHSEGEPTESTSGEDLATQNIHGEDSADDVNEEEINQDSANQEDVAIEEPVNEEQNNFILKQNNDDTEQISENNMQQIEEEIKENTEEHQRSQDQQTEQADQTERSSDQQTERDDLNQRSPDQQTQRNGETQNIEHQQSPQQQADPQQSQIPSSQSNQQPLQVSQQQPLSDL